MLAALLLSFFASQSANYTLLQMEWSYQQAVAGGGPQPADSRMRDPLEQQHFDQQELAELTSRALRVLLGSDSVLLHPQLRLSVLGSRADAESSSRSKCLLELAVASLVEQGLVVRQGYGPFAALSVPDAALSKAEALAYSEFPDEGQLPLYGSQHHPHRGLGAARASSCLNRLRRHSSPRQFGSRMAGIEKASGRRSKRGVGDDISNLGPQLQKKMRFQDGSGSGGSMCGSGGSGPYSPGLGPKAMSP